MSAEQANPIPIDLPELFEVQNSPKLGAAIFNEFVVENEWLDFYFVADLSKAMAR